MDHEQSTAVEGDASRAGDATAEIVEHVEIVDELLIEEISIDGMCGVY